MDIAFKWRTIFAVFVVLFSSVSYGQDRDHRLALGGGVFGLLDSDNMYVLSASYELSELENWWGIRPMALAMVGEDSAYYVGFGGVKTWQINQQWDWGFSSMVGGFHAGSDDYLGYDVEFYSRFFLDYKLQSDSRIRMEVGHISNAGFGDRNPGSESFIISWVGSL